MQQISQLKYFMRFSLFEISTMTAEEREFYLQWFVDVKRQENEAREAGKAATDNGPRLGPAAG
jgi:hypothetical protein